MVIRNPWPPAFCPSIILTVHMAEEQQRSWAWLLLWARCPGLCAVSCRMAMDSVLGSYGCGSVWQKSVPCPEASDRVTVWLWRSLGRLLLLGDPGSDEDEKSGQKMKSSCCVGENSRMLIELWVCAGLRVQTCPCNRWGLTGLLRRIPVRF